MSNDGDPCVDDVKEEGNGEDSSPGNAKAEADIEVDSLLRSVEQSMTEERGDAKTEEKSDSDFEPGDGQEYEGDENDHVIRVRGLPWSTKEKDVREFFSICDSIVAIHFTYSKEGRPTGEAYIEVGSAEDVERALVKNRELLGQRYIEVFTSKKDEMEFVLKRSGRRAGLLSTSGVGEGATGGALESGAAADPETVVRLRGLPFGCTKDDITTFFDGLEIAPDGIVFAAQHQMMSPHYGPQSGRRTKPGEAYVRFINKEMAELALDRHMNKIGHRYIEVFRSTVDEMDRHVNQPAKVTGAYGRGGSRPGPYSTPGTGGPVPLCSIPFPDFGGAPPGRNWNDGQRPSRGGGGGRGRGGRPARGGGGQDFYGGYPPPGDGYYPGPGGYFGEGGYDGMGRYGAPGRATGHVIHMRGLPYKAAANDIIEFFKPLKLVNVQILYDERSGRPSGEAEVELCTHEDALEAMKKDRQDMGGRYIELFLNSRPGPPSAPPAGMRPGAPYGAGATPQNGSGADGMAMMPPTGAAQAAGVNPYAAPPLVQYPGFGSYDYGRADASGMVAQPPPPPPSGPDQQAISGAAVGYY